jgi:methylmalonyl-CoA mutase
LRLPILVDIFTLCSRREYKAKTMQTKFPEVSKVEWLAKVEKDLRGKELSSLYFEVEGRSFSPLHHRDDSLNKPSPLFTSPSWRIGQEFEFKGVKKTNEAILSALNLGVSSIYITGDYDEYLKDGIMEALLDGVLLDLVEVYYDDQNGSPYQYEGLPHSPDWPQYFSQKLGLLDNITSAMGNDLFLAYSDVTLGTPFPPVFHVFTSDNFFETVTSFRALRLCWQLLSESCGKQTDCRIVAHPRIIKEGSDENSNRIASTTHAMAAVIGGADTIMLSPGDGGIGTDFSNRIATNVHHLLQFESYLDRVADPAAGSYFIEKLTDHYAEKIWREFQIDTRHKIPITPLK